jgi:hypothetical protein
LCGQNNYSRKITKEDNEGTSKIEILCGQEYCHEFGDKRLWIDREDQISQAEIWLEIVTNDVESAEKHLRNKGVIRRNRIEELPEGFEGFWITNPADIIHLVSSDRDQ